MGSEEVASSMVCGQMSNLILVQLLASSSCGQVSDIKIGSTSVESSFEHQKLKSWCPD